MSNADLTAAARTATQIDLADAATDDALQIAAYQAAIREGRTYYFGQVPGIGFHAGADLDEIIARGEAHRGLAPIAYKRFDADGSIVEVTTSGTEKAPRVGWLAGMAEILADTDRVLATSKSLVRR